MPARFAAASSTRRAAAVTSGPMPSPGSTTMRAAATLDPHLFHGGHDSRARRAAEVPGLIRDWQREADLRPPPRIADGLDRAPVGAHDVFRDRQPEPRAGRARAFDETIEDARAQLVRDSVSGIADGEGDAVARSPSAGGDRPARRRVAHGIREQIAEHTPNPRP